MNRDPNQDRLRRLERKVDNLVWMVRLQTALLAGIAVVYLLKLSSTLFLFLLIAVPVLVIFRRSIPQWGRRLGSLWATPHRPGEQVGAPGQHSASEWD
jgi:hypothetical protein